jgi:hypothetical protein
MCPLGRRIPADSPAGSIAKLRIPELRIAAAVVLHAYSHRPS